MIRVIGRKRCHRRPNETDHGELGEGREAAGPEPKNRKKREVS